MKTLLVFVYSFSKDSPIFGHQREAILRVSQVFDKCVVMSFGAIDNNTDIDSTRLRIVKVDWCRNQDLRNGVKFLLALLKQLFTHRPMVVFSFMTETQSALAGPILSLFRIPLVTWYAHTSSPLRLRVARFFSKFMLTSTEGSLSTLSPNTRIIGQLVDPIIFPKILKPFLVHQSHFNFIHIGRLDESKNIYSICNWFVNYLQVSVDFSCSLHFYGSATIKNEHYIRAIHHSFQREIEANAITFHGSISRDLITKVFDNSSIFVHCFQGSLDKTLIEATLMQVPVVTINSEYHRLFGAWEDSPSPHDNAELALASEFDALLRHPQVSVDQKLEEKRSMALSHHSLDGWVHKVQTVLFEATES